MRRTILVAALALVALNGCMRTTHSVMEAGPRTELTVPGDWMDVYADLMRHSRDCMRGPRLGIIGPTGINVVPLQTRDRGELVYDLQDQVLTVVYVEPAGADKAKVSIWGPTEQRMFGPDVGLEVLTHVKGELSICDRRRS